MLLNNDPPKLETTKLPTKEDLFNNGEQQFAMNFLKTSGHTHFEEKSKSVSDQHQTTDATASAVWFCRSFHQYLESKQLLAGPLLWHKL